MVEQTNRLQHTIHFADSTTPTSKAKPAGMRGAQVWLKVGTAPSASEGDPDFRRGVVATLRRERGIGGVEVGSI
jgi:hypothetical protein